MAYPTTSQPPKPGERFRSNDSSATRYPSDVILVVNNCQTVRDGDYKGVVKVYMYPESDQSVKNLFGVLWGDFCHYYSPVDDSSVSLQDVADFLRHEADFERRNRLANI